MQGRKLDIQQMLRDIAEMVGCRCGAVLLRQHVTGPYNLVAHLVHPEWVGDSEVPSYELDVGVTGWIADTISHFAFGIWMTKMSLRRLTRICIGRT